MRNISIFVLALFILLPGSAPAQVSLDYYLPQNIQYDAAIPTPESYLGYQVGEWQVRHDVLAGYMRALAAASDRITIEEYARTYEQRPLLLLTITSPENHRNLEKIRADHLALCDPEKSPETPIEAMPVVVWMGYSVHGNEASGANAALLVAYYLAAGQGEEIETMLRNTVILLDPAINPDGLGRFAQWANMHRSKNLTADRFHREHTEMWPSGRTNHYWFDLNRDWLLAQHPESRGRIREFHRWKPNVLTDHHEMGSNSTYFFQPGIPSRTHPLTPEMNYKLTGEIAKFHARELDQIGSLYYSKESFDDFYYGKGSTYPDVNGGIGILFEQASARGHLQESVNGPLSFPFAIRNQVHTSFSTLKAAQALRTDLLNYEREFFTSALQDAKAAKAKAVVFGDAGDPARAAAFLDLLRTHTIRVHKLSQDLRVAGTLFSANQAYVVPLAQPQFRLIEAIFEERTSFEDSLFYDISAWTMPLAFDLPHAELDAKAFSSNLLGEAVQDVPFPKGTLHDSPDAYAYVFSWQGYYAPRALYRLQRAGVRARVATRPFTANTVAGPRQFDYGAIAIPVGMQSVPAETLRTMLASIAGEDGLEVFALRSGLAESGIDLGSPSFVTLKKPKVMLVAGRGMSSYAVGEVWHLLDQRYGMDVSLVEPRFLNSMDLHDYTAIVLAGGNPAALTGKGKEALKAWVARGGTLIATGSAVGWAIRSELASAKLVKTKRDSAATPRRYADASRDMGARMLGGAIFRVTVDTTHPLAFGYTRPELSVFLRGNTVLQPSKSPYATPLRFTAEPLLSGYISKQNLQRLGNTAALVVSGEGAGRVILMPFDAQFRAFWYGTNKIMANSIFFARAISIRTLRGEEGGE